MSKETMKLALEALEDCYSTGDYNEYQFYDEDLINAAKKALREALEKPDFWEGYVPEPDKRQQALDKKAENARELGLDYEPAQQEPAIGDIRALKHRIHALEGDVIGYKQMLDAAEQQAQRKWQGLTDEERKLVRNSVGYNQFVTAGEYAEHVQKATEFKLLEKNT